MHTVHTHTYTHVPIHAYTDKHVRAHTHTHIITHNQGQNQTTQIVGSFQAHALNLTSFYLITNVGVLLRWAKGGGVKTKENNHVYASNFLN